MPELFASVVKAAAIKSNTKVTVDTVSEPQGEVAETVTEEQGETQLNKNFILSIRI